MKGEERSNERAPNWLHVAEKVDLVCDQTMTSLSCASSITRNMNSSRSTVLLLGGRVERLAVPKDGVQFLAVDIVLVLLVEIRLVGGEMPTDVLDGADVGIETGEMDDEVIDDRAGELRTLPMDGALVEREEQMKDRNTQ